MFDKGLTMNDRINKTSICSIVFLDIIDYSKKPDSEQIDVKNQFNAFINIALKNIAQNDRIILDTGDGAIFFSAILIKSLNWFLTSICSESGFFE